MFLLGFVLDFIEITYVVVPIVGPVLLAMGLDPVWLGIMIAINLQTSFLTPPVWFCVVLPARCRAGVRHYCGHLPGCYTVRCYSDTGVAIARAVSAVDYLVTRENLRGLTPDRSPPRL